MFANNHHHKRFVCSCGEVILQCRCTSPKEEHTVFEGCQKCKEKSLEAAAVVPDAPSSVPTPVQSAGNVPVPEGRPTEQEPQAGDIGTNEHGELGMIGITGAMWRRKYRGNHLHPLFVGRPWSCSAGYFTKVSSYQELIGD